jgi:hypothetical protein
MWILTKLSGSAGGYGSKRSGVLNLNHSCKHRLLSTIQCINSCDNGLTVVNAVVKVAAPALIVRRALAVPREVVDDTSPFGRSVLYPYSHKPHDPQLL